MSKNFNNNPPLRNIDCVAYADDYTMLLSGLLNMGVTAFVCIYHDKDTYTEEDTLPEGVSVGDLKSPHWHVLGKLSALTRRDTLVRRYKNATNQNIRVIPVSDWNSRYKYLTHSNAEDKGKYPYKESDILRYNEKDLRFLKPVLGKITNTYDYDKDLVKNSKYVDMFFDVKAKLNPVEMLRKYGRDYLYCFDKLETLVFRGASLIEIDDDEKLPF